MIIFLVAYAFIALLVFTFCLFIEWKDASYSLTYGIFWGPLLIVSLIVRIPDIFYDIINKE